MSYLLTRTGRKNLNEEPLDEVNPAKQGRDAAKAEDEHIEGVATNIDDAIGNAKKLGYKNSLDN